MKDRKTLFKEKFLDRLAEKIYNYAGVEDFGFQLVRDAAKEAYSELEDVVPVSTGSYNTCLICGSHNMCPHDLKPGGVTQVDNPKQRAEEGIVWILNIQNKPYSVEQYRWLGDPALQNLEENNTVFHDKTQAEAALQRIKEVLLEFHKNS